MGPAETTGIVIIVVAVLQGIFKFAEHVIAKYGNKSEGVTNKEILEKLRDLPVGLSDRQTEQLKVLYDLHNVKDADGMPVWYQPRSLAETQKEIVSELRSIAETQYKTLDIIERLENKLDS